jgi:hypothetical protein
VFALQLPSVGRGDEGDSHGLPAKSVNGIYSSCPVGHTTRVRFSWHWWSRLNTKRKVLDGIAVGHLLQQSFIFVRGIAVVKFIIADSILVGLLESKERSPCIGNSIRGFVFLAMRLSRMERRMLDKLLSHGM